MAVRGLRLTETGQVRWAAQTGVPLAIASTQLGCARSSVLQGSPLSPLQAPRARCQFTEQDAAGLDLSASLGDHDGCVNRCALLRPATSDGAAAARHAQQACGGSVRTGLQLPAERLDRW